MKKKLVDELPAIIDFFNLGTLLEIKYDAGSCANFFVTTEKGKYFIKTITEIRNRTFVEHRAVFANYLVHRGIPAALHLPGKDNSFVFEHDNVLAVTQNMAPGAHPDVSLATVSQIGRVLGKMGLVPTKNLPAKLGWLSGEYVKKEVAVLRRDFAHDQHAKKIFSALNAHNFFAKNIVPKLPHSIIHADPHTDNVLFRKEKLTAIVDWEDASVGPALFDFASAVIYWCFDEGFRPKIYKALYDSYTKERSFTKLEHEYLLDCIQYVAVLQTLWRFLNWENSRRKGALWALELPFAEILKI